MPDELLRRITTDPDICFGKPCIRGHRITVQEVLGLLARGATPEQILKDYPQLEPDDFPAVLTYAASHTMPPFVCGHDDEWAYFAATYEDRLPSLTACHEVVLDLVRQANIRGTEDHVILLLAKTCLKEYEEILLLCGNGYGSGSVKLLRTFYERAITLTYLSQHPDEIQDYIDYSDVHMHKLLAEAEAIHGDSIGLPEEDAEAIKQKYAAVRERFQQTDCKKCGTRRPMNSWTRKALPELASKADPVLRQFYFRAFLRPTLYSHATFVGMMWQVDTTGDAIRLFGTKVEHESVEDVLPKAHLLLVQAGRVLNEYFSLDHDSLIQELANTWGEAWKAR